MSNTDKVWVRIIGKESALFVRHDDESCADFNRRVLDCMRSKTRCDVLNVRYTDGGTVIIMGYGMKDRRDPFTRGFVADIKAPWEQGYTRNDWSPYVLGYNIMTLMGQV